MNADLKRVRENTLDDSPAPSAKRRLNSHAPSPVPTSASDDDGMADWMKIVEIKRKEAIYRQMLEYRRSSEREAQRANDLEAQRRVLEASFQAVEVCWTQIVTAVRDLAGAQEVELQEEQMLEPLLDPSLPQPELEKALQSRLPTTRQLIARFIDLVARNATRPASEADLQARCLKLEAEASTLRGNSTLLHSQISNLTESRDGVQKDLARTRKALDRERMEHEKAHEEWKEERSQVGRNTPGLRTNGSGHATPNGHIDMDEKVLNGAGPSASGALQDTSELEHLADSRLKQLDQLRAEQAALQQEVDRLKILATHPSESAVRESPFFQVYLNQLSTQLSRANALQERFSATEAKLDQLRDANGDFREAVLAEARGETEALRSQMAKKDADLARLRGQRDEMNAEIMERRAKEAEKCRFTEQMEFLASTREERIGFLTSEVRRLKGKLAAEHGSEGYLSFLRDSGVDGDYIQDLESKVSTSQDQVNALTSQLERVSSDHAAAISEVQVRAELEGARRALARYERILGPNVDAVDDVQYLATELEKKEKERAGLEMKLAQAEAATNALYEEVEGLSKLWESLDQTVKSKVLELRDGEQKITRLATEKAKADNKYFAAMRAKEAVDVEAKTAQRSVEKQLRLLERAQEVETSLRLQISTNEKGMTSLKNSALDLQTQLATAVAERTQLELRLQQSQSAYTEAQQIMQARVQEAAQEKEAKARLQDEVDGQGRQIKKLKERQESVAAATQTGMSNNEWAITQERDKLLKLLKCSCCEQNFKQQVIVKCMHTFCKQCLESRIASRQRKCPACGLAFAKEDIQTLYWQ
ncbi:E3 ubiquitin-protein ligase BRE1 [Cryptococcus amylolentus CBS 6273]|uniref:E3 ubiquitin protein ligase n=1 Tax=Cryptococcus amylolentus CBS 6273 TaxID=1296118 RepID=A0A1E3JDY0_9TREE|nr:E3 ubiquitin-protein ligase BRE1 [Cryptococcus amylolentus CBS 6273]